ncbi:expressed unknown protein [Seminavis robusta]|uniref:Uncharacterized protein n=1 Tax=Seminavis robusta TaxID=568900 RepID=A0A9N8HXI6_9STRA|nr:expressed unknown protein [Seminavis robusta]|eukprot:Sro1814_g299330.1 n/a (216) ;mRNA; r:8750-9397
MSFTIRSTKKAKQILSGVNQQHEPVKRMVAMARAAALNLGGEFQKFGQSARKGLTPTSLFIVATDQVRNTTRERPSLRDLLRQATTGKMIAQNPQCEEEEVILFHEQQQLMIDPEILLFQYTGTTSAAESVSNLAPVQLPEPVEVMVAVFRQRLVDQQKRPGHGTRRQRQLRRSLISTEEIKRRRAIERKLSLIRKGRFAPPINATRIAPVATAC